MQAIVENYKIFFEHMSDDDFKSMTREEIVEMLRNISATSMQQEQKAS